MFFILFSIFLHDNFKINRSKLISYKYFNKTQIDLNDAVNLNDYPDQFVNYELPKPGRYSCYDTIIYLEENISFYCDVRYFNMTYDLLDQYSFYINDDVYFVNLKDQSIQNLVFDKVLPTFSYKGKTRFYFYDFHDIDWMIPKLEELKNNAITYQFVVLYDMDWISSNHGKSCLWEMDSYDKESKGLIEKVDWYVKNAGWRKICLNDFAYLYPTEKGIDADIIIFSTAASWIIIVSIVLAVILLFVLVFFIAYYKYTKLFSKLKVENKNQEDSLCQNDDETSNKYINEEEEEEENDNDDRNS